MIQHVWYKAKLTGFRVIIATDDVRIKHKAEEFGAEVVMTTDCYNGTERCSQVAKHLGLGPDEIIINWQGDAPTYDPDMAITCYEVLRDEFMSKGKAMASFATVRYEGAIGPGVGLLANKAGEVMAVSRSLIPGNGPILRCLGLFAYRAVGLEIFKRLGPAPLEKFESMEPLRLLENGYKVLSADCGWGRIRGPMSEVNVPADIKTVEYEL